MPVLPDVLRCCDCSQHCRCAIPMQYSAAAITEVLRTAQLHVLEQVLSRGGCAGGLVQVEHFSALPDVGPGAAAAAVLASMAPLLASVWKRPDPARFACCVALASLNRCNLACLSPYHLQGVAVLLSRSHEMLLRPLLVPLALASNMAPPSTLPFW